MRAVDDRGTVLCLSGALDTPDAAALADTLNEHSGAAAHQRPVLDMTDLDAAPLESLDVRGASSARLGFGAQCVSLLFVDIVGRQGVRVSEEAPPSRAAAPDQIPSAGSVYDEVLRSQKLDGGKRGQRVLAPVTNRGETIVS
ncbi:hypothetical protein ACWEN3_05730 [Streptomyces sp. NPDC004561]